MNTTEQQLARLTARLAELKARLTGIEETLESHTTRDWEDLATEREGDEVLEGLGLSGQAEIRMIEAALRRIDVGDYGVCARCGAEISPERLDAVPYAPMCTACATAAAR